ncbi:hypothetical protein [Brachyspira sp.]|uniref:hypothetical protein n=1 Tax=Brachyspira sp. TaxID=1977261 RepID=UPI003D7D02D5
MLKRTFKTIAFLMIAVILVAGFVSCIGGADEITGSYSSGNVSGGDNTSGGGINTTLPDISKDYTRFPSSPDDNTNSTTDDNQPFQDDNPNNYYKIRVPFGVGGDGYTNVSYKDTNKLKQLWLEQINRKAANDGKVFAIKNEGNNRGIDNFQNRHTHGEYSAQDYYYFNENGDMVYKEDNQIIKKFIGAVIIEYRDINIERGNINLMGFNDNRSAIINISWSKKGVYTVGGIYANTLTTEQAREKYDGDNPFRKGVFGFVTYRHNVQTYHGGFSYANNLFERQYINPGFIEVFVMYDYENHGYSGAASVHSYYAYHGIYNYYKEYANHPGIYFTPENMPYMTNHNLYLGQKPDFIDKHLNHSALFSDSGRNKEFLFLPGHKN